jgi:RNA polymerase sigma-70 factor (ECF subfamily)
MKTGTLTGGLPVAECGANRAPPGGGGQIAAVTDACPTPTSRVTRPESLLATEFDHFYSVVHRYLVHRFFDAELAEELTAQTFYKAATAIRRVGTDRRRLQAWLLRVATNIANTHYRRRRLRQLLDHRLSRLRPTEAKPESAADSDHGTRLERVRAALLALRPKHQAVVVLRYYTQLTHQEIADVLGCRPDAARARLSRALKELRERLGDPTASDHAIAPTGERDPATSDIGEPIP